MRWIVKMLDSHKSMFSFVTQYNSTHPRTSHFTLTLHSVPTSRLRLPRQDDKNALHRPRTMICVHFAKQTTRTIAPNPNMIDTV